MNKQKINKLINEYWNEHEGECFYKDELKELIFGIIGEERKEMERNRDNFIYTEVKATK